MRFFIAVKHGFVECHRILNLKHHLETTPDIRRAQSFETWDEANSLMRASIEGYLTPGERYYAILAA